MAAPLGIDWPAELTRYEGARPTEIARALGVSSSAVYRALRSHRRTASKRISGDARSRIIDALRASEGPVVDGELWLPSVVDDRAVSTHGRTLALGSVVGAPVAVPGPFLTLTYRSPRVRLGKGPLLARALMTAFNRPPRKGETLIYRSAEVCSTGSRHYLDNLEWSDDRRARIITEAIPLIFGGASVTSAAEKIGVRWHSLKAYMLLASRMGGSDRVTARGLRRALPIFEQRVAETKTRIEGRLRWAISWDAVARKK